MKQGNIVIQTNWNERKKKIFLDINKKRNIIYLLVQHHYTNIQSIAFSNQLEQIIWDKSCVHSKEEDWGCHWQADWNEM